MSSFPSLNRAKYFHSGRLKVAMSESHGDQFAISVLNAMQWIAGGAVGGIVATWVIEDRPRGSLMAGVAAFFVVSVLLDFVGRWWLGFPKQ